LVRGVESRVGKEKKDKSMGNENSTASLSEICRMMINVGLLLGRERSSGKLEKGVKHTVPKKTKKKKHQSAQMEGAQGESGDSCTLQCGYGLQGESTKKEREKRSRQGEKGRKTEEQENLTTTTRGQRGRRHGQTRRATKD